MITNKKISVVLACFNEERYIAKAIDTLQEMDYPQDLIEILIIDGESTDSTRDIVDGYIKKANNITLYHNPKRISPVAFNIGIENSTGEFVVLMSAHSKYLPNYFQILISKINELNADLIGGYSITKTLSNTKTSSAIVKVMMNKFGLGGAKFRLGVDKPEKVDTVTGMFRKSIFEEIGLFNEQLVRNQDMEFSKRIIANGGDIYLIPDVSYVYYARDNYKDLWENNYRNGLWVPLTAYVTKNIKSLSIRHFVPLAFILSLIVPLLLMPYNSSFIYLGLLSLFAHFALLAKVSYSLNDKNTSLYHLICTFYVLHISYGIGSLIGLFCLKKIIK